LLLFVLLPAPVRAQHVENPQMVIVVPKSPLEKDMQNEIICMCGTCGRKRIGECTCSLAAEMRAEVAKLVAEGKTREQIYAYYIAKYGSQEPLASPIDEGFNRLAWFFPYLIGATVRPASPLSRSAGRGVSRRPTRRSLSRIPPMTPPARGWMMSSATRLTSFRLKAEATRVGVLPPKGGSYTKVNAADGSTSADQASAPAFLRARVAGRVDGRGRPSRQSALEHLILISLTLAPQAQPRRPCIARSCHSPYATFRGSASVHPIGRARRSSARRRWCCDRSRSSSSIEPWERCPRRTSRRCRGGSARVP
jgi:cytochrome c-type biogenesis protein CcmH/NrfF